MDALFAAQRIAAPFLRIGLGISYVGLFMLMLFAGTLTISSSESGKGGPLQSWNNPIMKLALNVCLRPLWPPTLSEGGRRVGRSFTAKHVLTR